MRGIVLDTNCLLASIPKRSPFRCVWNAFLKEEFTLCVSTEILDEYSEILTQKTSISIAENIISEILTRKNTLQVVPFYKFELIRTDRDDNKFVDCAIAANAEYLVSNDAHFRVLQNIPFPKVSLIDLQTFAQQIIGSLK